jgi:hypothetical protein
MIMHHESRPRAYGLQFNLDLELLEVTLRSFLASTSSKTNTSMSTSGKQSMSGVGTGFSTGGGGGGEGGDGGGSVAHATTLAITPDDLRDFLTHVRFWNTHGLHTALLHPVDASLPLC